MSVVRCPLSVVAILFAITTLLFAERSAAQMVDYRLSVTAVKPMELDRCDFMDHYVWLKLGEQPPDWTVGQPVDWWTRLDANLDQEEPNRPGPPACVTYAPYPTPEFEEVDIVFMRRMPLDISGLPPVTGRPFPGPTCEQDIPVPPIDIAIELWERDNNLGGSDDDLAFELLSDDTTIPDEGCVDHGVRQALLADYPDARLRIDMNVGGCGAPILIDALRFGGNVTYRMDYHTEPTPTATVASSSVLTFDHASAWGSFQTTVGAEVTNRTEGAAALSFASGTWTSVASRRFATSELSDVTNRLSLDVHIPDLPPDYYWFGALNTFVECPSAGLWKTFLGHQPLQILFDDEYNRVEFAVPAHVVDVLSGDYADCRFEFEFSTSGLNAPIFIDRGGFVQ